MWTNKSTPSEVDMMLRQGEISTYEAQDYCDLWNSYGHLTVAVVQFRGVRLLQWEQLTPEQLAHVDKVKASGAAEVKARYGGLI